MYLNAIYGEIIYVHFTCIIVFHFTCTRSWLRFPQLPGMLHQYCLNVDLVLATLTQHWFIVGTLSQCWFMLPTLFQCLSNIVAATPMVHPPCGHTSFGLISRTCSTLSSNTIDDNVLLSLFGNAPPSLGDTGLL